MFPVNLRRACLGDSAWSGPEVELRPKCSQCVHSANQDKETMPNINMTGETKLQAH